MGVTRPGLRRDVQGLRAVAVLVVVMNHLFDWPSGGFVGVDIFFVISGFLITDLMLRERDRTGRISWIRFYRRRIRRIIPVALVVLTFTVVVSRYVYPAVRSQLIRSDALWAAVFLSNWHFANVKTDYFNNEELVSPLQHFWSLAVEEQFYVVWPIVVIVMAAMASRRLPYRGVLGVAIGVAAVASFGYALGDSQHHATSAYFSTLDRVWELGVGALLAVSASQFAGLKQWSRDCLAWLGLAGIVASMVLINSDSTFPAPWAALPVISTAAVIAAGTGGQARGLVMLTNPVAQYTGNVSYSLYLWHFPVIVMMRDFNPEGDVWRDIMTLAVTATMTVFSFHVVEDPIRRSTWLEPRRAGTRRVRYLDAFDAGFPRRAGFMVLALALVSSAAFVRHVSSRTLPHDLAPVAVSGAGDRGERSFSDSLHAQINAALTASEFPKLSPTVDDLDNNKAPQWKECGTTGSWNAKKCTFGGHGSKLQVAVVGDSIALSWLPGLIKAFNDHGYELHSYAAGHCPAAEVEVGDGSDDDKCAQHRDWAISAMKANRPDIIIMSDASFLVTTLHDHAKGDAAVAEWQKGAATTLRRLTPIAPTVVLGSPPGSKNLLNCLTIRATPTACNGSVDGPGVQQLKSAEMAAAKSTGATYVDVRTFFCGTNGQCPSFVGTTPVYVDGIHLTRQYSERLAPGLASALKLSKRK